MSSSLRKLRRSVAKSGGGSAKFPSGPPTYWNGEVLDPPALKIWGTVVDAPEFPDLWYRGEGLVGKRIKAVAVFYNGEEFHLYDEDGSGWHKVTEGHGSPRVGHRNVGLRDIQRRTV